MYVIDRELAELHRTSAVQDSKAQEAALSAEMQVREELKLTIEKQQQQHKWEKDSLHMQVTILYMSCHCLQGQPITHCRLNELPHTIYWKILILILGVSGYVI